MGRGLFLLAPLYPYTYITKRQAECLVILLETKGTGQEIAEKLGISYHTVEQHIKILKEKLVCHSKKELIDKAHTLPWRYWARKLHLQNGLQ